jgi:AcrR family transcriptional regulator
LTNFSIENKINQSFDLFSLLTTRNLMPKVTPEHSQARRLQIIDAAYRCFARKGFHQTSMRDIYEEAQLSAGAVYHYFGGKDEIIKASFDHDFERSVGLFQAALRQNESLVALEEIFEFLFNGLEQAGQLGANRVNVQSWGEALLNPDVLATILRAFSGYRTALVQVIRKGQETGKINPEIDPEAAARVLNSLYLGLELQMAWEPDTVDVKQYLSVVKALLRGNFTTSP